MSSPYVISIQGVKQTKDNKFKQTTLRIHRSDEKDINFNDLNSFVSKMLTKKQSKQKITLRGLTPLGWMTYMSHNEDFLNIMSKDEYLNGRVEEDTKFTNSISQFQIIISEF